MRKLILSALMTAVAIPAAAVATPAAAQSWRDVREERRDVREERRELERAYRSGNPRRIREERRDLREEQRELRQAQRWGRNDWRGYRQSNRDLYRGGRWDAPFRYQGFRPGVRIAPNYWGQRYWINDPYRFRLPPAGRFQRWVRHYNDVILVDTRRGIVLDVLRGFYW
jgi:Ni/Co efflux regulator RcnB